MELHQPKLAPAGVLWSTNKGARTTRMRVLPDQPALLQVAHGPFLVISYDLKDKLSLDEWSPLVYSYINYITKLGSLRVIPLLLFATLISTIIIATILPDPLLLAVGLIAVLLVATLGQIIDTKKKHRNRLQSDLETSARLGRSALLDVLRKVDSMHLPDAEVQKENWFAAHKLSARPSLTQRIANLTSDLPKSASS